MIEIAGIWLLAGFSFWVSVLLDGDPPPNWKTYGRIEGWDMFIFCYLPLSLFAGPILWILAWWIGRK